MDSVEGKMEGDSLVSSWEPFVFSVEHEAVENVFPPGPHESAGADELCCHYIAHLRSVYFPHYQSAEHNGDTVPRSFGEIFNEGSVEHNDVTNGVN